MKRLILGTATGAGIGILPGLFSATVGSFVPFLQAAVYTQDASSLVIYVGLLIGGAAGAIVSTLTGDDDDDGEEADVEPAQQASSK